MCAIKYTSCDVVNNMFITSIVKHNLQRNYFTNLQLKSAVKYIFNTFILIFFGNWLDTLKTYIFIAALNCLKNLSDTFR